MTQGISKNPLNDISAVYLREIAEGRLKQLEKASALAASDNPADQDKAREIRVRHDYESLKKQIGSKKKPTRAAVKEENVDEGVTAKYKGKQYKLLPGKVREKMSGAGGLDGDYRTEIGKVKDAVTDKLGLTNTKRDGVKCPKGQQDCGEGFSDWRTDLDLREITSDAKVVDGDSDEEPEITEKKVKNKIKINPTFKENAEELAQNLGGQLLEVAEVVGNDEDEDGEPDDKDDRKLEMMRKKEKQLKKRMIRMKMMAINQTDGDGIVAHHELEGEMIEGVTAKYKGKNYKLLPGKVREKMSGKGGLDGDYRDEVGKAKDWVTDKLGITNTKRDGVKEEMVQELFGIGKIKNKIRKDRGDQKEFERAQAYIKKNPNFGKKKKDKDRTDRGDQKEYERAQAYLKKNPNFGIKEEDDVPRNSMGKPIRIKDKIKAAKGQIAHTTKVNEGIKGEDKEMRRMAALDRAVGKGKLLSKKAGDRNAANMGRKIRMSPSYANMKEEVQTEDRTIFKKAMSKVFKKKQEERKPEKAQDAGARLRRKVERRVHAKYVSGSEDNVPDDIRDHYEVSEAKVDKGRSDYGKATIRNWRHSGPSTVEPAMFDPENKRGKTIDKRREEHKARRGVKGAKVPAYKVEGYQRDPEQSKKDRTHSKQPDPSKDGFTGIGNMSIKDIMKMNAKMKKEKKQKLGEDKALAAVRASIIKKHGKGAIYDPKKKQSPEDKAKVAAERKKRQDVDNKAYAARAKKAGFKSTQDYTDVVARYGSEDNYKKGKGLGT